MDGEQCAPLKSKSTPDLYSSHDKTTEASTLSRYGMTCAHLTASRGAALLTSFREDFPVKTSAPRETAPGSTGSDRGFGGRWRELSVRFDRDSRLWKTHHCLWEEDLQWCSVTLPKWGMMQDGVCSAERRRVYPRKGIGSGLWPAPACSSAIQGTMKAKSIKKSCIDKPGQIHVSGILTLLGVPRSEFQSVHEWIMGWPIGWSQLEPLATDRCPPWLRSPGRS